MKSINNYSKQNFLYKDYLPKENIKSPFIDEGEFLPHRPPINRTYLLDNFEYLTDCNNELITIGKGGYGKLYLAKNKIDNKEYAIKYVSKKKMQLVGVDFSIIKREIDIHIRITHPRIIKLLSYLEDRYNFYLALEYAPKGTLYQLIQHKKGMGEDEAFYYFIQVASAIHFLHINGYAHRDIKPENILLDANGGIKLCDFGWCVNVAKGERTTFCGTYEYMAPEMINDEFYDMGIDIWSLGVLLYEMIHGYSPFRANLYTKDVKKAQVEIFINIKNNNYSINKNISQECIDLIDKLLTTDTTKRIKIQELFKHPWVVNKEKEYFPYYNRHNLNIYKNSNNNIYNNSITTKNISDSNKIKEKRIDCTKSLDFKNLKKNEFNNNGKLPNIKDNNNNIDGNNNSEQNDRQNRHLINSSQQIKNKSYCFVYTKGNSSNNGVYFIQGQSGKKSNQEIQNKEKDKNIYEFNKLILNESNTDYIMKNDKNNMTPNIVKKEINSKNNFVYNINTKRKKINLPKVNRAEKKTDINNINTINTANNNINTINTINTINSNNNINSINTQILEEKPLVSNEIKSINIKFNEKPKNNIINNEEKINQKILTKSKTDQKSLIRVQRQEIDDFIKRQNEINYLNLKMQKIKEKQELVINRLRKMEEKKRREESLQKMHDSHKSSTSCDYYTKTRSLKNQYSFLRNKSKKEVGSYTIKRIKKDEDPKKNKFLMLREKLKEKRSYSYQHMLADKISDNKLRNLITEKRNKFRTNNIATDNKINYLSNQNYNYKNINNNGEDDIITRKNDNFKRFRKMVVHLKKRNNLHIQTGDNFGKRLNSCENNTTTNNIINKISNNQQNYLKTNTSNKSIQNIYYNTFYNCLFNNNQKNNNIRENKYYNNNLFDNKNNNLKVEKEHKSISSEKNIYKFKNMFRLNEPKNNEYSNQLNKNNKIINYSTERKKGNLYKSSTSYEGMKNKSEKNKLTYTYYYRNNLLNSKLLRSLSNNNNKNVTTPKNLI